MIIIGEKLNSAIGCQKADTERDADFIIARSQRSRADAAPIILTFVPGQRPDRETEDLRWLIRVVQDTVDIPLCIDSPSAPLCWIGVPLGPRAWGSSTPFPEGKMCRIAPHWDNDWQVIGLTCSDDHGIRDAETKKLPLPGRAVEPRRPMASNTDEIMSFLCTGLVQRDSPLVEF